MSSQQVHGPSIATLRATRPPRCLWQTRKYVADIPDYDTKYVFEIEFRPKDIPDAERIQRLVRSITTSVDRVFDIKNLQVTGDKNSIDISWQAPEFKGNENYVFKVFRTELGDPDTNEYID